MRLGVDLGGTKTEIIALDDQGCELLRRRVPTARSYDGTLAVIAELVRGAESELGGSRVAPWPINMLFFLSYRAANVTRRRRNRT
jgi:predicted NBD/HSP70 family sugar kinase